MMIKRKLQVSNGNYLEFDQTARLIHSIANTDQTKKITMSFLEEETGLPIRQVRNRVSVARAIGLLSEKNLQLTLFGNLIATHDPFFENRGSLEYAHYTAAGNYKYLIWYEVFKTLLVSESVLDYPALLSYFREALAGLYSEKTLKDHLAKEVRFVIEAYTENSLKELELLSVDLQGKFNKRRYLQPVPLIFCAILYNYAEKIQTDLIQVKDLLSTPGSPPMLFFMGRESLNDIVELLHTKGYLRYEGTHDLDQLRLKEEFTSDDFLIAYYEGHEPESK